MVHKNTNDEPLLEDFEELPQGVFDLPDVATDLQSRILARTSRVVAGRRTRRRIAVGLAAVLIFGAGTATGLMFRAPAPAAPPKQTGATRSSADSGLAAVVESRPLDRFELEEQLLSAAPAERRALLRRTGDHFLSSERPDPTAALYYYRRLLANNSPGETTRTDDDPARGRDSWLLTYLKLSKRQDTQRP